MSKCYLAIKLDQPDAIYSSGSPIKGVLEVEVNKECKCNDLTLTLEWYTHGAGNVDFAEVKTLHLFKGHWAGEELYEYPFEFEAPAGPLSYHGHYINVDWQLHARADVPWAIDPKANVELLLEAGDGDACDLGPAFEAPDHHDSGLATMALSALSAVALLGGLAILGFTGASLAKFSSNPPDAFLAILGLVLAGAGCIMGFFALRNSVAARKLGPVELDFEALELSPDEPLRCTLRFTPKSDLHFNSIRARLYCEETAVSGSGTRQRTYEYECYSRPQVLLQDKKLAAESPQEFPIHFDLPQSAPYTFMAYDNRVVWNVELHFDIPMWPDWVWDYRVVVRP